MSDPGTRNTHLAAGLGGAALGVGAGWALVGNALAAILVATLLFGGAIIFAALGRRRPGIHTAVQSADLAGLAPKQALAKLSAATGGKLDFESPQLVALEGLSDHDDPAEALAAAQRIQQEYPRSPVVAAELCRRYDAAGDDAEAARQAKRAVTLALDGGMNAIAAKLFAEFRHHRETFTFSDAHRRRLAGAAQTGGDDSGAAWCRAHGGNAKNGDED